MVKVLWTVTEYGRDNTQAYQDFLVVEQHDDRTPEVSGSTVDETDRLCTRYPSLLLKLVRPGIVGSA